MGYLFSHREGYTDEWANDPRLGPEEPCYCHHLIFPGTICPNCNEVAGSSSMMDKPDWVLEEERQAANDEYLDHIREDQ